MLRNKMMCASMVGLLSLGTAVAVAGEAADLPPNAKPGECYARVAVPPVYTTSTERVQTREASERVEIVPAQYEWVTEQVMVKEGYEKLEIVPAKYTWAEERVMVTPATTKKVEVPAEYGWVTEEIVVKPAQTVWKKGRGPVERVDNATGEIMCLVEEPAVTKTVRKKVLKTAATTKTVEIPADYTTVKKQVLQSAPATRTINVPAEYKTVKVRKLVSPATEKRIPIPAEFDTVTKQALVTEGRVEWRPILCETNMGGTTVAAIQSALKSAGHNPGPIDGVIGSETMSALRSFQRAKGLPTGAITIDTLDALGVRIGG